MTGLIVYVCDTCGLEVEALEGAVLYHPCGGATGKRRKLRPA